MENKIRKAEMENEDSWENQSLRARKILEYVMEDETPEKKEKKQNQIDIEIALHEGSVLEKGEKRNVSRVLFVTRELAFLEEHSEQTESIKKLGEYFGEIHMLVIVSRARKTKTVRVAQNVWIHHAYYSYWWSLYGVCLDIAKNELMFNEEFRPDIVVGYDCFEDGLIGYGLAKRFKRPFQLHIRTDFTSTYFLKNTKHPYLMRFIAKFLIKRSVSLRTTISHLKETIKNMTKNKEVYLLPNFFNVEGIIKSEPNFDVHNRYKDFSYIALTVGELSANSPLHDLFSELHSVFHNPKVGLVVIGDGPARALFREKVKLLGIEKNVVFVYKTQDVASYYKTSDVFIETDISAESEKHILRAVTSGLPIIARSTELREDLFTDGDSAFLCSPDDQFCLKQKFNKLLNNNAFRKQFKKQALDIARTRLIEDPDTYYSAYRDTIEHSLVVDKHAEISKRTIGVNTKDILDSKK